MERDTSAAPRRQPRTPRLFAALAAVTVLPLLGAPAAAAAGNPHQRPVGPVQNLVATTEPQPALQSVVLEWDPPAGDRLMDHYLVYGSRRAEFTPDDAELVVEAPTSRYTHAGIGPDPQTWHYRVVPIDAAGNVGRFRDAPQVGVTTAQAFVVGATGSSQYSSGYTPAHAVDGSFTTRWAAAATDDEWLQVELVRPISAGRVELYWQGAYAVDYDLLVSADGESWVTVATVRDKPDAAMDAFEVSGAGEFRYVRMHGFDRATRWGFSIWEFWVRPADAQTGSEV